MHNTQMPEDKMQKQVATRFKAIEAEVGSDKMAFFAVVGGSVRLPPYIGKRLKDSGVRSGVHDLFFLLAREKLIPIELKTMIGSLSPAQKDWHGIVKSLGFNSYTVKATNGEDAIKKILTILAGEGFSYKNVREPFEF